MHDVKIQVSPCEICTPCAAAARQQLPYSARAHPRRAFSTLAPLANGALHCPALDLLKRLQHLFVVFHHSGDLISNTEHLDKKVTFKLPVQALPVRCHGNIPSGKGFIQSFRIVQGFLKSPLCCLGWHVLDNTLFSQDNSFLLQAPILLSIPVFDQLLI